VTTIKKKFEGETGTVLLKARELADDGWDVLYFAVSTEPSVQSTVVMGAQSEAELPYHYQWAGMDCEPDIA
jgi:hypothetical protein